MPKSIGEALDKLDSLVNNLTDEQIHAIKDGVHSIFYLPEPLREICKLSYTLGKEYINICTPGSSLGYNCFMGKWYKRPNGKKMEAAIGTKFYYGATLKEIAKGKYKDTMTYWKLRRV